MNGTQWEKKKERKGKEKKEKREKRRGFSRGMHACMHGMALIIDMGIEMLMPMPL
jgi:hypothetical protein